MTWLAAVPFTLQLALVAALLIVDAGLLIGVFVPSGALLAALAAQVGDDPALLALTIGTATVASIAGTCAGYWRARTQAVDRGGWLVVLFRARMAKIAHRAGTRMSRCPRSAAAIGQCFAGARTVTPRLAAKAGIPLSRVLAGSAPAALLWACAICAGGALLTVLTAIGPALYVLPLVLFGLLTTVSATRGTVHDSRFA